VELTLDEIWQVLAIAADPVARLLGGAATVLGARWVQG